MSEKKITRAAKFFFTLLCCAAVSGITSVATFHALSERAANTPEFPAFIEAAPQANDTPMASINRLSSAETMANTGNVRMSLANVVEKAAPSVVEVFTEVKQVNSWYQEYVTGGAGSGVILSADGYIVTNHHVIDGANTIKVRLNNSQTYQANLTGSDEKTDLAVIKIQATGLTPVTFTDSLQVRVGDLTLAIGNPLGELGGTVTDGIVSALDREITIDNQPMTLLQTSAAVNPGNSGGGLFDANGNLLGVVNAKSSVSGMDIEGLGFAIPSNTVKAICTELIQKGYVSGRPQLGITVREITNWYTAMQSQVDTMGVYVYQTTADNGLRPGDRLVSIGEQKISSSGDITYALSKCRAGDVVEVTVVRNGQKINVNVTLTEKVPAAS